MATVVITAQERGKINRSGSQWMFTKADLYDDGRLEVNVHTQSDVLFAGTHGRVYVELIGDGDQLLARSRQEVYGVEGKLIGKSRRDDSFTDNFPPSIVPLVRRLRIVQGHEATYSAVGKILEIFVAGLAGR